MFIVQFGGLVDTFVSIMQRLVKNSCYKLQKERTRLGGRHCLF